MSGRYPLLMHIPTTVNLPDLFSIITWELQHQGCHVLGKKCHIGLAGFSNPVSENLVTQVSGNRAIPISFHTVWSLREEEDKSFYSKMASRYDFVALRRNRSSPSSESRTTIWTHNTRFCSRFLGVKKPMLKRRGTMLTPESTLIFDYTLGHPRFSSSEFLTKLSVCLRRICG